jgi:hypothetical protein
MPEGVAIPMFPTQVADGVFTANELNDAAAQTMLDELSIWADALKGLRASRK